MFFSPIAFWWLYNHYICLVYWSFLAQAFFVLFSVCVSSILRGNILVFFEDLFNMSSPVFSKEDFARWNQTTSVFHIPKRLAGKDTIPQVRAHFIKAIGETKVKAVQALPENKIRVEFKSPSLRHQCDINGISFRGVTLTPFPAYEEIKKVFVDRAPLQMPDNYLFEALAPYGRVLSVQHLTVRGFPNIKSGTRMVSMSVNKANKANKATQLV